MRHKLWDVEPLVNAIPLQWGHTLAGLHPWVAQTPHTIHGELDLSHQQR